jgi:hypothetical protein
LYARDASLRPNLVTQQQGQGTCVADGRGEAGLWTQGQRTVAYRTQAPPGRGCHIVRPASESDDQAHLDARRRRGIRRSRRGRGRGRADGVVLVYGGAGLAGSVVARRAVLTEPSEPSSGGSSSGDQILSLPLVNPFSPTSFWNAPLAAVAPLDPNSQAYVNELLRQVQTYGTWMDTYQYSVPVYVVGPNQATQHVTLDVYAPDLQAEFDAVPIPSTAQAAAGTDEHMTVWQPSTDKLWEFWHMQQESDGWHARWGGEMDNVSTSPGYFTHSGITNDWGATATGLPLLGGLVTEADLQRGYINHALAISIVETEPNCWSWPAQRTDGAYTTTGITPIPEGARFRLNPTINVASLDLPPLDTMLAQAAQTYGIVVRDKGGAVSFYGEDPKTIPGTNPWPAEFENTYVSTILARFPWSDLQTLQTQMTCAS